MQSAAALIESWVAMWNSYDLGEFERLFLQDERLTYLSSERQGTIRGPAAILEHHKGFGFLAGGKTSENRLWLADLESSEFGDVTIIAGKWLFRRGAGGREQKGPVTFVCVREGAQGYRLAHLNFGNYPE